MNGPSLEEENRALQERLNRLKKLSKKVVKPKKEFYLNPVKTKDIVRVKDRYHEVSSKLDYDMIKDYNQNKQKRLQKRKHKKEMSECTFAPKLNKTSKHLTKNMNYVAPHQKKLRRKVEKPEIAEHDPNFQGDGTTFNEIMQQFDRAEQGEQMTPRSKGSKKTKKRSGRKANPDFYEKQLKWLNKKNQTAEKQRLEKAMKEFSEVKKVPKTNKKKNQRMLGNRKHFMDRVDDETMKIELKREQLKEKYHKEHFVPRINRNYNVESKVKTMNNRTPRAKTSR